MRWVLTVLCLFVCCSSIPAQEKPAVKPRNSQAVAESPGDANPAAAKLPVRRVVLYKNGVGYFEHLGRVRGSQDVHVDFTSAQLNDVLKSLTSLQQWLVKTGGRLIKHARYFWLLLAESQLTRRLLRAYCGGLLGCQCQQGSSGFGSREIDPKPPGTEGFLTKSYGKAAVSSFGTRVGADGTLSRAAGPSQREDSALESLRGMYSVGLLGAKTEIPDNE